MNSIGKQITEQGFTEQGFERQNLACQKSACQKSACQKSAEQKSAGQKSAGQKSAGQGRAVSTEAKHRTLVRSGFSLLEMLLALAILGGSLGILSQIAMTGTDAAQEAELLSQARLIAQSQLAVLLANEQTPTVVPPTPVEAMDSSSSTSFEYQVDVAAAPMTGMLAIRVTVRAINPDGDAPLVTVSLTRWLIDPIASEIATTPL